MHLMPSDLKARLLAARHPARITEDTSLLALAARKTLPSGPRR